MPSLSKIKNLSAQTVLLRADFNVPILRGKITDDYRIKAGLESIEFLLKAGAKVIVISHLGDPAGRRLLKYSLRPVAARLKSLLGRPLVFVPDIVGPKAKAAVARLKNGQVLMLENLRFHQGEYQNDSQFASELASLADIYVNDAFAVNHRAQASLSAIKKYLPSYAGLLLSREVEALDKVLKPKKPLILILGGFKVSTKAPLIKRLHAKSDHILIGGALANNFLKVLGYKTGKSIIDQTSLPDIKQMLDNKSLRRKLVLPLDLVVKNGAGKVRVSLPENIKSDEEILDIGPATIAVFSLHIKEAKTLLWNGPMGKFEDRRFKHGTLAVGSLFAARSSGIAYGVAGGGETIAALAITKMSEYVDWVSTAGGAMLAYIGGAKMPGLEGIVKK